MRITKEIEVNAFVEQEIEVTAEDVRCFLEENIENHQHFLCQLSKVASFLNVLPDCFFVGLNEGQRETIIKFFETFLKKVTTIR